MREIKILAEYRTERTIAIMEQLLRGGDVDEPEYSVKVCRRFDRLQQAQEEYNRATRHRASKAKSGR